MVDLTVLPLRTMVVAAFFHCVRQDQKQASIRISSLKKTNIKIAVTDMDVQKTNHNRNLHSANLVDSYVNLFVRRV